MKLLTQALQYTILVIFVVVFGAILLAAPAELVWESLELLRMDSVATGVVEEVKVVRAEGEPELARSVVNYNFLADGRPCRSDRLVPGYICNLVFSEGGDAMAARFGPGRRVTVYYQRSDPDTCSLEFGWFVPAVALAAILGGVIIRGVALKWMQSHRSRTTFSSVGIATTIYGLALPLFVEPAVRFSELPFHFVSWLALFMACLLFAVARGEASEAESERKSSWEFIFGAGEGDD